MQQFDKQNSTSCISHSLAILLIPFLFLLGLVLAYVGIFSLNVELHTLAIVTFIFVIFAFFVKHNANYAVCHMKGSFFKMEEERIYNQHYVLMHLLLWVRPSLLYM